MKAVAKKIILVITAFIFLIYLLFAFFLWFSEYKDRQILSEVKSIYSRKQTPHKLTLLNSGISSFKKRLDLIDQAKESIELEFFIYELDSASKLLTSKIVKAARRGVKVKVLVDFSVTVFKLAPVYAKKLIDEGVEVKYYNTASNSRIITIQHRNHRKLLVVDSKYVFIGGRNIADDYFDLSDHYNFLDSDVLIEGEIVNDIRKSFYSYWSSDYSSAPVTDEVSREDFFKLTPKTSEILSQIEKNSKEIELLNFQTTCDDISYITDNPGVFTSNRQVYKRLELILSKAKKSIVAESPYLVLRKDGLNLMKKLTNNGADLSILTNSLKSTDAYYTVSALSLSLSDIKETKARLFVFNESKSPYSFSKNTRYGLHAKRAVVDSKHSIIGTYNIDPRSANFNSEVLVICRNNEELAKAIIEDIELRKKYAIEPFKDKSPFLSLIRGASRADQFKFFLSLPLSRLFDFLL
ncbi:MAG: phosphatidylserine/phosphatidylglycerophosphate/cardiolipin synthase family protein [Oligoflexia bacterium]|nr:phosphatidylserine/phosphatidylglycerophosphate/cardiolipin synthase family protein [Oligoflexia bacterium]